MKCNVQHNRDMKKNVPVAGMFGNGSCGPLGSFPFSSSSDFDFPRRLLLDGFETDDLRLLGLDELFSLWGWESFETTAGGFSGDGCAGSRADLFSEGSLSGAGGEMLNDGTVAGF